MSKEPFYEFKILLVGDPAVGKTSLILRFLESRYEKEYKPSIGVDIKSRNLDLGEKAARVVVWDIASQRRFERFRSSFYQQANGVMVVFDLSRLETLEAVDEWVAEVHEFAGEIPILLVGNKTDLRRRRKIRKSDVQPWIARYKCKYVETSALSGTGVEDAFKEICLAIIEHEAE